MPFQYDEGVLAPGDQLDGDAGGTEGFGPGLQFQAALGFADADDAGVVEGQGTGADADAEPGADPGPVRVRGEDALGSR